MSNTKNIILIGMPGCGKTSIGITLAQKLSKEFADTDEWITKTSGKSIPDIFAEDGEEAFRKLETAALKELCGYGNFVIASGGGIVTRPENLKTIKQNGIVIFLDRELSQLPVSGRPLSQKEGIEALAKVRLPLYSQWCDYKVAVNGIEQTAEYICEQILV